MVTTTVQSDAAPLRSAAWVRLVCAVLFLATFLNYANRITFTQNPQEIRKSFAADEADFGWAEALFGWGFAAGGLTFGFLADKISIRWLYPGLVLAWSVAGALSGAVESLPAYGACRFLLGMFEAGHWPCALRMTQRTFLPAQRTWGNSVLQSGAALGQILTPLLIVALSSWDESHWRLSCLVAGAAGVPWAIAWIVLVRESDVTRPAVRTVESPTQDNSGVAIEEVPFWKHFTTRRWWLLLVVVVCINTPWHYVRVWMPDTLRTDHAYDKSFTDYFTSLYYLAAFFGSLSSGWITSRLALRGWRVPSARLAAFFVFALLTAGSVPAAFAPRGPWLLGTLIVVAFGSLGLFPIYYSLTQELSGRNQGKVNGTLGFSTWTIVSIMQWQVGRMVKLDPTIRPWLFAAVGLGPLLAFFALALFWKSKAISASPDKPGT